MKNNIMSHIVGGYPTSSKCLKLLLDMQSVGACAVEVQVPFSDPSADGSAIMAANRVALENGMTTNDCFKLIKSARQHGLILPVYVMSYINKVYSYSIDDFCRDASMSGVNGLIIPDVPYDTPEYAELFNTCTARGLDLVPVLSPGIGLKRLQGYTYRPRGLVYVTSNCGTTGQNLALHRDVISLVKMIHSETTSHIAIGFGISTLKDVTEILNIADIAVVGTVITHAYESDGETGVKNLISKLTSESRRKVKDNDRK